MANYVDSLPEKGIDQLAELEEAGLVVFEFDGNHFDEIKEHLDKAKSYGYTGAIDIGDFLEIFNKYLEFERAMFSFKDSIDKYLDSVGWYD